jgi:hypothetical protein
MSRQNLEGERLEEHTYATLQRLLLRRLTPEDLQSRVESLAATVQHFAELINIYTEELESLRGKRGVEARERRVVVGRLRASFYVATAMLRAELATIGAQNRESYLTQIRTIFTVVGEVTGMQELFAREREMRERLADLIFPPEEPE